MRPICRKLRNNWKTWSNYDAYCIPRWKYLLRERCPVFSIYGYTTIQVWYEGSENYSKVNLAE